VRLKVALSQRGVHHQAQRRLALCGNPFSRASNQIEIGAAAVCKDRLQRGFFWTIGCYPQDVETPCFSPGISNQHPVTWVQIPQAPEDGRAPTRSIKMSVKNRTASLTWGRSSSVPADSFPGMLCRCCQIAVSQDTYLLYGGIDVNSWDEQARGLRPGNRCRRVLCLIAALRRRKPGGEAGRGRWLDLLG